MVLSYVTAEKLSVLDEPKSPEGDVVLKLLSMVFNAVSRRYLPEQVIGPRLIHVIDTCLRKCRTVSDRTGYLTLLRALFRSLHSQVRIFYFAYFLFFLSIYYVQVFLI